jgi:hypothetical protein
MLQCGRCEKLKDASCFNKDRSKKRGYSSYCKVCKKERELETKTEINTRRRKYYTKNKKRILELQKQDRVLNPEKYKKKEQKRKDQKNKYYKKYYEENREVLIKKSLDWAKKNKGKKNAQNAKRRAQKLKATPIWCDLKLIQEFYKNCPEEYHVDHIYPLQNDKICGLHVIWNLQYLPASENMKKSNKLLEDN